MRMNVKGLRWAFWASLVLGIALALVVVAQVLREPAYRGRPITYWFHQLQLTGISGAGKVVRADKVTLPGHRYGSFLEKPETVAEAFRVMGTNALPLLLRKLNQSETPLHRPIQECGYLLARRLPLDSRDVERQQATTGLLALSPLPPDVLRQVAALTTNANPKVAAQARCVLAQNKLPTTELSSPQDQK
jgi:hypothetical protein